ncbi:hypothetical protein [Alkalicoccus luteus]|uniref:Uncharacterized protein n=1 Tax=Alkalicoccus luteus TaxID=1237094 RepID=A0A969PT12_9BACI|nr:hypothetical protein [Alkalicoccus luteus]NJP38970.1 hypothetical protein [Alkalicoccus luteus]
MEEATANIGKQQYIRWGMGILLGLIALFLFFHPELIMLIVTIAGVAVIGYFVLIATWKIAVFLFFFAVMIAGGFVVLGGALWLFN